jgi:hypothetical protein
LQAYLVDITGEPIGDLSDVLNAAPAEGHALLYNFANSRYENRQILAADVVGVAGISGVAADGQVAVWTGPTAIEGTADFSWDSATQALVLGDGSGSVTITGPSAGGGYLLQGFQSFTFDGGSVTIPTFGVIQAGVSNQSMIFSTQKVQFGNIATQWEIAGLPRLQLSDGAVFRHRDGFNNDAVDFDHDGTHYNITAGNVGSTTDLNFVGFTGRVKQDAETLAYLSEIPGGGGGAQLSDLTDVNTSTPTNRNVLVADGVDWESRALVEADISDLQAYGFGDVTKVGTPANDQLGVWTGDGTIEGAADLTYNGTVLTVGGASGGVCTGNGNQGNAAFGFFSETNTGMYRQSAGILGFTLLSTPAWFMRATSFDANIVGGPRIQYEASTDTNPVFCPFLGTNDTGVGGVSGTVALIGSGVTLAKTIAAASGGLEVNNQSTGGGLERVLTTSDLGTSFPLLAPNGSAGAASYSFSADAGDGMWRGAGGDIHLESVGGNLQFHALNRNIVEIDDTGLFGTHVTPAGTPYLVCDVVASATDPVYSFAGENNTGIGKNAVGELSFIGASVEQARTVAPASGGLMANNTATGAGIERVLTTSDIVAGSAANDAVQARRTTDYTLTTAFVDVTLDTTDIETDSAVIDHDLATNSDNIIFGVAGTYEVTYDFDVICTAVSGDPIIDMGCRVRLNDAGTGIAGSHANPYVYRDGSVGGATGQVQKHVSNTFIVTVSATDFITFQADKTELSGSETFNITALTIKARRLL